MRTALQPDDALLVVDMQNDFLPGGSLAVPDSAAIIPQVNSCIERFTANGLPVFASRDFHPTDHISFVANGGQWPPHCVAGTWGAEFHPDLRLPDSVIIISKGTDAGREAYSALDATPLSEVLEEKAIERLFVCGLATDYCVLASAKDLLDAGYLVTLITDSMRAVNVHEGDGDRALQSLIELGASTTTCNELP
ncbi:isochorismatase family protein [Desulfopila aestuarii]|uniref:nicotinamidase n=1 Tax=Desulfopila aestuarii DSM 18488 TaxID=1121416 RepID=A0A1M7Y2Z5_9BACT|nr:isochorismatase family protein [Desulfopila aestuarii]SHO46404.1 nicotinamidase/pyrazinamidase [Desulfopila aestuarii DSM 18488]